MTIFAVWIYKSNDCWIDSQWLTEEKATRRKTTVASSAQKSRVTGIDVRVYPMELEEAELAKQ